MLNILAWVNSGFLFLTLEGTLLIENYALIFIALFIVADAGCKGKRESRYKGRC